MSLKGNAGKPGADGVQGEAGIGGSRVSLSSCSQFLTDYSIFKCTCQNIANAVITANTFLGCISNMINCFDWTVTGLFIYLAMCVHSLLMGWKSISNIQETDASSISGFSFLKGPPGPNGAPGPRGEDGNPGPRVSEHVGSILLNKTFCYVCNILNTY